MEHVCHLEEDLNVQQAQWVTETVKKAKVNPVQTAKTTSARAATVAVTTVNTPLPWLTYDEKTLLMIHKGCYNCQLFYAGHLGCDCPIHWATLEACKAVMVENVAKAKVVFNHNSAVTATATHIMAVFGDTNDKITLRLMMQWKVTSTYQIPLICLTISNGHVASMHR